VGFEPTVQLPVHGISSAAPSATRPPLPLLSCRYGKNMAEGRGFEPPRDSRPYPISSRTPSTGLGHPSPPMPSIPYRLFLSFAPSARRHCRKVESWFHSTRSAHGGNRDDLLDDGGQVARREMRVPVCHPPSSLTVRKSTPAATKRKAKACRSACHITPSSGPGQLSAASLAQLAQGVDRCADR